jgi:excisionase family DNA binding protein
MSETMMTVNEVAAYLSYAPATVCRKARDKTIPAVRVGREWRFRKAEIDEWRNGRVNAERKTKKKRASASVQAEPDWLEKCRQARAMLKGKKVDAVKILREIREERASRAWKGARS